MRYFILCFMLAGFTIHAQNLASVQSSDGTEIFYETFGEGDPVFLLSGGPGLNPQYLMPLADKVSETHMAVIIHQRGTGKSVVSEVNPESMSMKNYVADFEAVRKALGGQKVIMLGHSWGGMMSMEYASVRPESIDKMILVAPGGPDDAFFTYFGTNIQKGLYPEDLEEYQALQAAGESTLKAIYPGYFFSRQKALASRESLDWDNINGQPNVNGATLTSWVARAPERKRILKETPVKAIIIQGRQDPIDPSTAFQIRDLIPDTELHWIESCGHFPWLEEEAAQQKFEELLSAALTRG